MPHKYKCVEEKDLNYPNPHSGCGQTFDVPDEIWEMYATGLVCLNCGNQYIKWLTYKPQNCK
jgi:hypothetical protein